MTEVEQILLAILNAVGVDRILKLIAGSTSEDRVRAILDAEYAAARAAINDAATSKFGQ